MTPADAQRIANEFEDAYRAASRGVLTADDGRLVRLPLSEAVAVLPQGLAAVKVLSEETRGAAVSASVQSMARRAARHFIDRQGVVFYRLPHTGNAMCALADTERLPCRVEVCGPMRDRVRIEVGVQA